MEARSSGDRTFDKKLLLAFALVTGGLAIMGFLGDTLGSDTVAMSPLGHLYPLAAFLCFQCAMIWLNGRFRHPALFWSTIILLLVGAGVGCLLGLFANPLNWINDRDMTQAKSKLRILSNVGIIVAVGGFTWLFIYWLRRAWRRGA